MKIFLIISLILLAGFSPVRPVSQSPVKGSIIPAEEALPPLEDYWLFDGGRDQFLEWSYNTSNYGDGITDIYFNDDGLTAFLVDNHVSTYGIHFTSFSESFNPSSGQDSPGQTFSTQTTCGTEPNAIGFNSDKTEFTITDNAANSLCVYNGITSTDIQGAVFFSSTDFSSDIGELRDFKYYNNGLGLIVLDVDAEVLDYTLGTAYRPSTKGSGTSYDFSDVVTTTRGFEFGENGNRIIFVENNNSNFTVCDLLSPYDLSTRDECNTADTGIATGYFGVQVIDNDYAFLADISNDSIVVYSSSPGSGYVEWSDGGANYNTSSQFSYISQLDGGDIALIDSNGISTIRYDGSYTKVGNTNSAYVGGSNNDRVQRCTSDSVWYTSGTNLAILEFDGTDWTQSAHSGAITISLYPSIAYLEDDGTNCDMALWTNSELQRYTFNGSTISTEGSALTLTGNYHNIAGMGANRIIDHDTSADDYSIIEYSSSSWTVQSGELNANNLSGVLTPSGITSDKALVWEDGGDDVMTLYWDGSSLTREGNISTLNTAHSSWPRTMAYTSSGTIHTYTYNDRDIRPAIATIQ